MSAQDAGLQKIISVDFSSLFNNGVCDNCIWPIPQKKTLTNSLYFFIRNKNYIVKYDFKLKSITRHISIIADSLVYATPFFVDKNDKIYCFARQKHQNAVVMIAGNDKTEISSLEDAWLVDEYNVPFHLVNSYVDKYKNCYMYILRKHNIITAATYFEDQYNIPVVGKYNIKGAFATACCIPFCNPTPQREELRLSNNYFLFDVDDLDKKNKIIYYQNRCTDTIYSFNEQTKELKKTFVYGSNYSPVIPVWYNPKESEIEDIKTRQNIVNTFLYNAKKSVFVRHITINSDAGGAKNMIQIIAQNGKITGELKLDDGFVDIRRFGDGIYIYAKNNNNIDVYQIN